MLTRRIARPFEWLLGRIVAGIAATGVPPNRSHLVEPDFEFVGGNFVCAQGDLRRRAG